MKRYHPLSLTTVTALFHIINFDAQAAPLDPASCDGAKQEQALLIAVPPLLERGPAWAQANASPDNLKQLARWIELSEMLAFRCGRGTVTQEARRAAAAAELIENPPPAAPAAPPVTPAVIAKAPANSEAQQNEDVKIDPPTAVVIKPAVSGAAANGHKAVKPKNSVTASDGSTSDTAPSAPQPPRKKRVRQTPAADSQTPEPTTPK